MQFIDLPAQYRRLKRDIDRAVLKTIGAGQFILGANVAELESRIAKLAGTAHSVGLNSGTDALFLTLKALDIGRGDEVITTPFSFVATGEMVAQTGATPVFADINPKTYTIEPSQIRRAITKRTKAVIPVHLYGQMADMRSIMQIAKRHRLAVIEDAAQALGARQAGAGGANGRWRAAGSIGHAGCFSFFPTKNLGACGDGGMITTNDGVLAERIRLLRNHGSRKKYHHEFLGYSSRLDELQAAILLVKLPHLKNWNSARANIAANYTAQLRNIPTLATPVRAPGNTHIFHQYTVRTPRRDALRAYLERRGVPTSVHYPLPIHLQPSFRYLKLTSGAFPESERASREALSLPIYPEIPSRDIVRVVKTIREFFSRS